MAELVRHTHTAGSGLNPEQIARLNKASRRAVKYTDDCPRLTDTELEEFEPVNDMTWEERAQAMQNESPALVSES